MREFSGFTFDPKSQEYVEKLNFFGKTFTDKDLKNMCDILCLEYENGNQTMATILENLKDIRTLAIRIEDEEYEDPSDEDDDKKTPKRKISKTKKRNTCEEADAQNRRFDDRRCQ